MNTITINTTDNLLWELAETYYPASTVEQEDNSHRWDDEEVQYKAFLWAELVVDNVVISTYEEALANHIGECWTEAYIEHLERELEQNEFDGSNSEYWDAEDDAADLLLGTQETGE